MKELHISQVEETDLPLLIQLEQQTFLDAFESAYKPKDVEAFLHERKNMTVIHAEWTTKNTFFYILRHTGTPAGFLKLNLHKQPDNGTVFPEPVMELERIYLLSTFTGKQLGKELIAFAYQKARHHFVEALWLGVWEHNHKAQRFYEKEGFLHFGEHNFMVGQQQDRDLLLVKRMGNE